MSIRHNRSSQPTALDAIVGAREGLFRYQAILADIGYRIDAAGTILHQDLSVSSNCAIAAQYRMCLEDLLYGGLVAHSGVIDILISTLKGCKPARAQRIVQEENPDWWPKPVELVVATNSVDGLSIEESLSNLRLRQRRFGNFLMQEDWGTSYGFCSSLLRPVNPVAPSSMIVGLVREKLIDLHEKLVRLLELHVIEMEDGDYRYVMGCIHGNPAPPRSTVLRVKPGLPLRFFGASPIHQVDLVDPWLL